MTSTQGQSNHIVWIVYEFLFQPNDDELASNNLSKITDKLQISFRWKLEQTSIWGWSTKETLSLTVKKLERSSQYNC